MTQHSAEALRSWARDAWAGEELVWFRGDVALARDGFKWDGHRRVKITERAQRELRALSRAATELGELGVVTLVQRRYGEHDYGYTMQRLRGAYRGKFAVKPYRGEKAA